jgi:ComF family protein
VRSRILATFAGRDPIGIFVAQNVPLVRRAFESAVSLLAPDVCAGCDARIGILRVFCAVCAKTLTVPGATREGELAAFAYGGALAAAITSFKYGGRVDRARPLSHLLLAAIDRRADGAPALSPFEPIAPLRASPPAVVVPVPLHRRRLSERGYNHAALLAAPVARALGARFAPTALLRLRDTPAQATLDRSARLENVEGAFRARGAVPLAGRRVLLVDDVRTTGATLEACARALRAGGAAEIATLVLAVSGD